MRSIEEDLEARYREATGSKCFQTLRCTFTDDPSTASISLALPDVETHPALSLDSPMPAFLPLTNDEIDSLCDTFFRDILIFFGFLSPTRLNELIRRHRTLPATLTPDQLALLYAIFALGFFRQATYAQQPAAPKDGPVPFAPGANRLDIVFYRHGMALLEVPTTLTALQALVVLQLYAMSSTTVSATRHLISKMVYCAGELGLHSTAAASAYPPETHATSLSFYVLFTDTFYAGLTGEKPFLRIFDREIFTSVLRSEGIFTPAMVRLVCLEHDYLKDAHAHRTKLCDPTFVLGHEAHLFAFLRDFGTQTGDSTNMSSSFATTQYAHLALLPEHRADLPRRAVINSSDSSFEPLVPAILSSATPPFLSFHAPRSPLSDTISTSSKLRVTSTVLGRFSLASSRQATSSYSRIGVARWCGRRRRTP